MNILTRALVAACITLPAAVASAQGLTPISDVQLQVVDGQIVTGVGEVNELNEQTLGISLGERVFNAVLTSNFATNNPGFNASAANNPLVVDVGADALPANTDINFDFLPVFSETGFGPLLYWDGLSSEVEFAPSAPNVTINLFDIDGTLHTAQPGLEPTIGGPITQSSSVGSLHQHNVFVIDDGDGNFQTTPDEGIYLFSLQIRADGVETSDPILLIQNSQGVSGAALTQAVAFANENLELLIGLLPGDFNDDGSVDAADYTVWRDGFGTEFTLDDYQVWLDNFGSTSPAEPAASAVLAVSVPEPSCLLMAATLIAATASRRRLPIR